MQESEVRWEPMYEEHLTWFTKVFVLYLAVVLFVSVFRAMSLTRRLRKLQKARKEDSAHLGSASPTTLLGPELAGRDFQPLWQSCYAKVALIMNLSMLTFLLSLLLFAWSMTRILQGVAVQKVTESSFLASAMAQVLTTFSFGIIVCGVLYAVGIFYEGVLARRKMEIDHP